MGYRSRGLIAIAQIEYPESFKNIPEEEQKNIILLFENNNIESALQLLISYGVIEKDVKNIQIFYTNLHILKQQNFDRERLKDNIWIFEFDYWKWSENYSEVKIIIEAYNNLEKITDTHFIRIGEDYEDVVSYGNMHYEFYISREINSNLLQ